MPLREELAAIRHRCAALPVIDDRLVDAILGYDGYALAKISGQPLLYKGDDFAHTEIPAVGY